MKIPSWMLITLEIAKESPIGMRMVNENLSLISPKHCYLATFLLQEKSNPDSKWKNYLNILPKNFDNFPIFYTEEEMKWLEGSPFHSQILDKIKEIRSDYNQIISNIPEYEKFSLKDFQQIRMAVSSRIFGIKINNKKTDCFAPLADMLNHKRPRKTRWYYSDQIKSFVIHAVGEIEKGEEIFDSYGRKCNSRFLLNYGFVVEENESNEFPFFLKLESNHPFFDFKNNFLTNKYNKVGKTFKISENFMSQNVLDLFSFLRFLNYDEDSDKLLKIILVNENEEAKNIHDSKVNFLHNIHPISIKNEISVLKNIQSLMELYLSKYPTDIETDQKLFENSKCGSVNLTNNQRNCLILSIGEKKILHTFLNFSKFALELFDCPLKEIKNRINKAKQKINSFPYESYTNEVILHLIRLESSSK